MPVSFDEFVRELKQETEKLNEKVDTEFPEILGFSGKRVKESRFETGLHMASEIEALHDTIEHKEEQHRLLGGISDLRGEEVLVTGVQDGLKKGSDFFLNARSEKTGMNVDDIRLRVGVPERKGEDLYMDGASQAIAKEVDLPVYNMRLLLTHPRIRMKKVA